MTVSHGGIIRGDSTKKKIALVFTAHEFADGAAAITKILTGTGTKANFFFTGDFYRSFPKIVRQLKRRGHYLGAHGDKHLLYCSWQNRDSLLVSREEFLGDLKNAYEELKKAGIPGAGAKYFLPPYEWYNDSIAKWTGERGLVLVNFTPGTQSHADYTYPELPNYRSNAEIYESIVQLEDQHGLNGFLLLFHFGTDPRRKEKFYPELGKLINELKKKGYKFVRLNELLNI